MARKRKLSEPQLNRQAVGNIGLYYTCYQLSRLGWNVMPTSRNARGIDILAYSDDAARKLTIQVKSLSKRAPVPLGGHLDHLYADFVIVCRRVVLEMPECFVLTPAECKQMAHKGVSKTGVVSYWLQPQQYEVETFKEQWARVGSGLSVLPI